MRSPVSIWLTVRLSIAYAQLDCSTGAEEAMSRTVVARCWDSIGQAAKDPLFHAQCLRLVALFFMTTPLRLALAYAAARSGPSHVSKSVTG